MNWDAVDFDWNHVRAFLASVEEGSLSAAARALGQTQPTLSRQVTALEQSFGLSLFERGQRRFTPTPAGAALLEHIRAMGQAAAQLSLRAAGQSQSITGHVSVSASELTAAFILPPALSKIRAAAPSLKLQLIATNDVSDINTRMADIAIRHSPPKSPDLIAKRVADMHAHLYATSEFLATKDYQSPRDIQSSDFVALDPMDQFLPIIRASGFDLDADLITLSSPSANGMLALVQAGAGIGFFQNHIADAIGGLTPVFADKISIRVPIWLVTHKELHTAKRIRLVFDEVSELFRSVKR